jgi:acetyl esterase/lipase
MGCPEHIFALHKAYLYAVKHYNLSRRVLVAGASMGGHTAMNFAHTFPGIVAALGLFYPRLNMDGVTVDGHYCIGTWDKTQKNEKTGYSTHDRIVQIYRFPEDAWHGENTVGFNPYLTRSFLGVDGKRVVIPPCPIKIWQGDADTTVDPVMTQEFLESVRRSGSYIECHIMDGLTHKINDVMRHASKLLGGGLCGGFRSLGAGNTGGRSGGSRNAALLSCILRFLTEEGGLAIVLVVIIIIVVIAIAVAACQQAKGHSQYQNQTHHLFHNRHSLFWKIKKPSFP